MDLCCATKRKTATVSRLPDLEGNSKAERKASLMRANTPHDMLGTKDKPPSSRRRGVGPKLSDVTEYFYLDASGEQAGPVSASELQRKFKSGELNADCMAWKEGMAEWTPISKLPELAATAAAKTACECCSCSDSQVAVARFLTAAPPCFRWLRQHGVDAGHDEDKKPGARREEGGCP